MAQITRRTFLAAGAAAATARGAGSIDDALRSGIQSRKIPAVAAMAATDRKTLYTGAFGKRDSSGVAVTPDSIFQIASMTKAITTVAALQFVEKGKVSLTDPIAKHLPQLADLEVLETFDATGKPLLRKSKTLITLNHLLTHTSGLCYDIWDEKMFRYTSQKPAPKSDKPGPLMFQPGTRWQYGQGIDWAGRLVEKLSGQSLEQYFQQQIFQPLGMKDTSYILPPAKFDRLVTRYQREPSGEMKEGERKQPNPPKSFNGGGGLYSTVADYTRFMQMILNYGAAPNGRRVLQRKTVEDMSVNHIGKLTAGKMKSFKPSVSSDVDIQPGFAQKWGLGFLINVTPYVEGRSANSLAWAGINNTFYWIDPIRQMCGVIMMQFQPFVHPTAIATLDDFERSVYRTFQ